MHQLLYFNDENHILILTVQIVKPRPREGGKCLGPCEHTAGMDHLATSSFSVPTQVVDSVTGDVQT
jgi:hypothetical protein